MTDALHFDPNTGIAAIGVQLPPLAMDVRELAALRGVDPDKYTLGLGCDEMALCPEGYGVVDLAVGAAKRALAQWGGSVEDIGLLVVGSESAVDMSRPLSAFVAEELGLRGRIRSYETKHACYGGTVALRQALEWRLSGAARGKAALVIASDVALYAPKDPGEPTQGAGAVAMIIAEPKVARIATESFAYAEPAFDFWRPVGDSFPSVEGKLSLDCYKKATEECFQQLVGDRTPADALADFAAVCFHVPFPKMVKKAVGQLGESFEWTPEATSSFYEGMVNPTMDWNRKSGNGYTASLWISVAQALAGRAAGQRIGAFSYGSGFGSELLVIEPAEGAAAAPWADEVAEDLKSRRLVSQDEYDALRGARLAAAE